MSLQTKQMPLSEVLAGIEVRELHGPADRPVGKVTEDSRQVAPRDVFVAVPGRTVDGHDYVAAAVSAGAAAIIAERAVEGTAGATVVLVPRASRALALAAANRAGHPSRAMTMVGLTGTNGKTTTTYILERILVAAGHTPAVIGTVSYRFAGRETAAPFTTPTAPALQALLGEMKDAGCSHVVMEVSSHALELDRVVGLSFRAAGFSNFTQDHLDLHGSMEQYRAAKERLFAEHLEAEGVAVLWVDDPAAESMVARYDGAVVRVSAQPGADVHAALGSSTLDGIRARLVWRDGSAIDIRSALVGSHNLNNLALAAAIARELGVSPDEIARGVGALDRVPGRLDRVPDPAGPDADIAVLVDYAHTPDALTNALGALRPLTAGRLLCVFGCGGDRDQRKRPLMGRAVSEVADVAVVTSDNPRSEDPLAIIEHILPGMGRGPRLTLDDLAGADSGYAVDPDRRAAIGAAVAAARAGDVVLIAGKGHEPYQILGDVTIHFDDREEGEAALRRRLRGGRA